MINEYDEYDITKNMLSIIRDKNLLKEGDNEAIPLTGSELEEERSKIDNAVGSVFFDDNAVVIYPHSDNAITRGRFSDGLTFEMSVTDGVYITASSLQLTDTIVQIVQRLNGFYQVWKPEMIETIREYKKNIR